jgi:outer membrane protein assembly factor BamB
MVVLSDRGLESARLFEAIVGLRWHPLMRAKSARRFRPHGLVCWGPMTDLGWRADMQRFLGEGRIALWSGIGLFVLFGSLVAMDSYVVNNPPTDYESNHLLLEELKVVSLPEENRETASRDWPQWRGPQRDGISRESGLLGAWPPEGPRVLWRASCGDGYTSVVVADGRAFTHWRAGDDELVGAWDATTGQELWRFGYAAPMTSSVYGAGPSSTPIVDHDRLYTIGATGVLHCFRPATGQVVWRKDLVHDVGGPDLLYGVCCSPLIEGDLLLTNPGGKDGHSIVALDKRTGAKVWACLDDPPSYSSPIAATFGGVRQIVFFTGKGAVGLAPKDGKVYWEYPWATHGGINVPTPIAQDDYLFITSGYQQGCALLKIVAAGGGFRVERVYESRRMSAQFSSCVLYRDHIYGFPDPGLLTCMEFRTGKVLWQQRGFGKGTLLAVDGKLVAVDEAGKKFALVEATPAGYRELGVCRFAGEKCWSAPALAQGRLYLRNQKEVTYFDLGSGSAASSTQGQPHHD